MAILQSAPGVRQITRLGAFSCHLVEHDDGLTLVDTNFAGSLKAILQQVTQLGKPLRRVLLTHAHADHVGSLDALKAALPGIDVVAGRRTAQLLTGDRTLEPEEQGLSLKGGFVRTSTRPNVVLDDGESHAGFTVVATPGHAVGHVSWLQVETGYLFAGDAFISVGGLHVTGVFRPSFPFPYFATASHGQAIESARRIAALRPTVLLPVHGPAVPEPAAPIARAIEEAERQLNGRMRRA